MTDPDASLAVAWFDAERAKDELNITVSEAGLKVAREELLSRRGLAIGTTVPPSYSWAVAVVYQALANAQATQSASNDEMGGQNTVRLYPFDRRIMAMLVTADPDPDNAGRDLGYVRSLIG
uniref:hypothetical protein n=1 Tax=Microbacterium proteolyticum TaxID=1572644 RepID=UPI00241784C8|nr:hypothetical protein [Microbacterium proteolyticum]